MHGYTYRNASLLRMTVAMMRLCGVAQASSHPHHSRGQCRSQRGWRRPERHHGQLSDGVANQVGLRFNEVWHVVDNGKDRVIALRPCRLRKPMKTRLFNADKPEFIWHYDPNTQVGEGIADWYHAWQASGGRKLALPARAIINH